MTDVLSKEIEQAQEKLRAIDGNLAAVSNRPAMTLKRRFTNEEPTPFSQRRSGGVEVVSDMSGRRDIRRSFDALPPKRIRDDDFDDYEIRNKSLQSQVVMPTIETKSRATAISEMRDKEVKEVKNRNRRLFGSLLVGTLQRFQKDEKKISSVEKAQAEKQAEVEKRLENQKQEERQKAAAEREKLMNERREQERVLKALQRKRALMQYAEEKTSHYRRLANFIGTKTTPTLFFLPAKHTLQSLEMLKQSSARMQELIVARENELEKELEGGGGEWRDEFAEEGGKIQKLRTHLAAKESEIEEPKNDETEVEATNGEKREGHVEIRMDGEESDGEGGVEVEVKEDTKEENIEDEDDEEEPIID